MSEYIGVIDDIGGGQANMYVTSEPIVRCRDCKHFLEREFCECGKFVFIVEPDGFCAWGERKDG